VQRVRVGLVGLAAVILLIGLAGMIFSTLRRDQSPPETGVPATTAAVDTNASDANDPLADLGITPSTPVPENATAK